MPNRTDRITIYPTKNDDDAEIAYFDGSDMTLADADSDTDDFDVDLDVGANTVKVKVTAEDNDTTQTYTVVVTREAAATGYEVWSSQLTTGSSTDDNAYGYCVTAAGPDACSVAYGSLSGTEVSLDGRDYVIEAMRWYRGGNNIELTLDRDFPVARLSSLWLEVDGYTFPLSEAQRASSPDNTYFWVPAPVGLDDHDEGDTIEVSLLASTVPSSDATLRGLELKDPDDGSAIDLNETFAPGTTAYPTPPGSRLR